MPALRVDDIALDYDVRGGGAPIVLLHGFTSSHAGNWGRRGWIDLLADNGFRVVGLDFPSHSESERVYDASRVTTDRLAAEVVAVLDHLDIERPDLFGFSMGGGVALKLAMDHRQRPARAPALQPTRLRMAHKDQRDAREADVARRDRRRAEPEEGSNDSRHEQMDSCFCSEGIRFLKSRRRQRNCAGTS
jgi:alpha-beta hydrolase superfamily lysophospholipase